jgi:hypothetical protein
MLRESDHAHILDGSGRPRNCSYAEPPLETCYSSVTAILGLDIFDDQRRLLPRSAADLVVDGDGSDGDCE